MEKDPPIWSTNIVRNYERIIEWCEAIILTCDISPKNYDEYMNRKCYDIESEDLQQCIKTWGSNFGYLPKWVMMGVDSLNNNSRIPANCVIDTCNMLKFEDSWNTHIKQERQVLDDLKKEALLTKQSAQKSLAVFYNEESDEYSSYSDYSEESTDSEEEEEEEEENEEKESRKDRKRNKK